MSVNTVPLGELCEILSGFAWSASKFNQDKRGIPIIRIQNVDAVLSNDFVYWDEPYAERFIIRKGDILLTLSGSFRIESWSGPDALLNQRIIKLTPTSKLTTGWLLHMLRPRLGQIERLGKHALVNNVSLADIRKLDIPLPPLAEQRRIAEVLDKAEALRAKRRAALAQLDSLTQSLFLDLFGDPGSATQKFPVQRLGEVALKITDGEHQTPKRTTEGIKLLSARNIRDGFIDTKDVDHVGQQEYERIRRRCDPQVGDILISCSGTIGRVAIVKLTEPLSLVRSVALVKPDRRIHEPEFMEHYLRTPAMKARMIRSAHSSSQANLFQGPIRELDIFIPPLDLQREFARRVAAVEKLKTAQCAALTELDALFASLQHRAFRGEL